MRLGQRSPSSMPCSEQFQMAGQLVQRRFTVRPQGQDGGRTLRDLRVAGVANQMNRDVGSASLLHQTVKVGRFRGFDADFFLARSQPRFHVVWMAHTGFQKGLHRSVTHLSSDFSLAHSQGLVNHAHQFYRAIKR